jgi:hypothetical protein
MLDDQQEHVSPLGSLSPLADFRRLKSRRRGPVSERPQALLFIGHLALGLGVQESHGSTFPVDCLLIRPDFRASCTVIVQS